MTGGGSVVSSGGGGPVEGGRDGAPWPSGLGGAQCDECGATTVVRDIGEYAEYYWICRPCYFGDAEAEMFDVPSTGPSSVHAERKSE